MAGWRIEATKRRSECARCSQPISAGSWRFGTPSGTRWFHLECAAAGAPVKFPAFKREAEEILKREKPTDAREIPRAALESALAAEGKGALEVLADLLTQHGDPWGELLSLHRQRKEELADAHFRKHHASLLGELERREVEWRDGAIFSARFEGKSSALADGVARLGATRTAGRVRELSLTGSFIDAMLLSDVSRRAPSITSLRLSGEITGLKALNLPRLHTLRLLPRAMDEGLLEAKLPALRVLRMTTHEPLEERFLEGLLESKLLAQLEWLGFEDELPVLRTLSDSGLRLLLEHKKRLQPIKALFVDLYGRSSPAKELAAAKSFFGKRIERAQKLADAQSEDED